ncbi:MAG: fibronectin type III domain-containing protein, partial [Acidimicrobiales bacterium]
MRAPRIVTALVLVSGIMTSLALEGGGGIAGADSPTAISGSGQVVAVSNSNGSVTLTLSGRWTWSQSCTARYGLAWAVAWTGRDTPTTPNPLSPNGDDGNDGQGNQGGNEDQGDRRDQGDQGDHGSKDLTTLYFGSKYDGMDLFPAQCTTAGSDSHRDSNGDQGNGDQGNGDQGNQSHHGQDGDSQSTGTWSADHTFASASVVPAELCVNFYDLGGRPGVRSSTATKSPGGDAADPDNALQDGNFDWGQDGNCIQTPPIVTGIAPASGPARGGTGVTITGSHFRGVSGVTFGTTAAATYVVESTTSILAVTPAGSGTVPVTVASAAGTSGTGNVVFQFIAASLPTPPATPTVTRGTSSLVVSWTAPRTNGTPITAYAATTTTSRHHSCTAIAPLTTCTITGLANGTNYTVTVAATNVIGTGAPSAAGGGTPAGLPLAPATPTTTRGTSSAVVSWTAPGTNGTPISGYTVSVFEGATKVGTRSCPPEVGSAQSCTITGLTNGTTYAFTVAATNGVGTGTPSSTASATPAGVPFAPATPTVTRGTSSIVVDWSPPGANGTPIVTYTATTTTPEHYSCAARSPSTTCTITGLANGTTYTVTVTATNGVGVGAPSTASGATPAGDPFAVSAPTVRRGTSGAVVSWTAPGTNGTPITGYTVTVSKDGTVVATKDCAPSAGSAQSCTVTGLANGTTYSFTVAATNGVGTGTPSSTASGTPAGVPFRPDTPTVSRSTTRAIVSWTAPGTNGTPITGYTVTVSKDGTVVATRDCAPQAGTAQSCTINGLANGTTHTFTVAATNGVGTGPASQGTSVTPAGDPLAPAAPTVTKGTSSLHVSWSAPGTNGTPVSSYTATTTTSHHYACTAAAPASSCTITGLTNGATYTVEVVATNGVGAGPASPGTAGTPAGAPLTPAQPTVTRGTSGAVVSWTAPGTNGTPITGYTVTSATPHHYSCTAVAPSTTCTLTGLANGTRYT